MSEYKCTLWPSGEVLTVNGEDSLLSQLKAAGKKIKSTCGGCATCSDCTIIVKSGESNFTPQTFEELRLLGNVFHITKERLSCQAKLTGDVTIDISAHDKNTFTGKGEKPQTKNVGIVLRKREEIAKEELQSQNKDLPKAADTWFRHWEKEDNEGSNKPKRLGGNKRVKPFKFVDKSEDEE